MKLNRNELKKIICDYNSICNRLLQSDFNDYLIVLRKFLNFLKETEIIYNYIINCGECKLNIEYEIRSIISSHRHTTINLGDSIDDEIINIFCILEYLSNKDKDILINVLRKYRLFRNEQEITEGFNKRVVLVLIEHIKIFLTKIGVNKGMDDHIVYNISHTGQVNISNDLSTINANNTIGVDADNLRKLIDNVRNISIELSSDDSETLSDCLETIENESFSPEPQKSSLKVILKQLSNFANIKSGTEFSAAVLTLCDYTRKFFNLF